jgi:hypothetical protein
MISITVLTVVSCYSEAFCLRHGRMRLQRLLSSVAGLRNLAQILGNHVVCDLCARTHFPSFCKIVSRSCSTISVRLLDQHSLVPKSILICHGMELWPEAPGPCSFPANTRVFLAPRFSQPQRRLCPTPFLCHASRCIVTGRRSARLNPRLVSALARGTSPLLGPQAANSAAKGGRLRRF